MEFTKSPKVYFKLTNDMLNDLIEKGNEANKYIPENFRTEAIALSNMTSREKIIRLGIVLKLYDDESKPLYNTRFNQYMESANKTFSKHEMCMLLTYMREHQIGSWNR